MDNPGSGPLSPTTSNPGPSLLHSPSGGWISMGSSIAPQKQGTGGGGWPSSSSAITRMVSGVSSEHSRQPPPATANGNSPGPDGWAMQLDEIKSEVRRIVPTLTADRHKGQSGKVAVLGGCREYTGAPYFAAFAALRVGSDLSHVFCTHGAAAVIKCHSPELIVHPYFRESTEFEADELGEEARAALVAEMTAEVESWFSRLDCLVVGPGLGRDPLLLDIARSVIQRARAAGLPLVLDGDGLFLVAREPALVEGYSQCILTPNLNEFRRLCMTLGVCLHGPNNDRSSKLMEMTQHLRGPTVISKGPDDALCDGAHAMVCNASGGAKRCGGQGDILAGVVATFAAWAASFWDIAGRQQDTVPDMNPMMLAAYGGCLVTRTAAAYAFAKRKRSMVAGDMLETLGSAMEMLFDHSSFDQNSGAAGGGGGAHDAGKHNA
ncbi:MAG: hypothetical protein WDW36_000490 [Sanguina aurantia]